MWLVPKIVKIPGHNVHVKRIVVYMCGVYVGVYKCVQVPYK